MNANESLEQQLQPPFRNIMEVANDRMLSMKNGANNPAGNVRVVEKGSNDPLLQCILDKEVGSVMSGRMDPMMVENTSSSSLVCIEHREYETRTSPSWNNETYMDTQLIPVMVRSEDRQPPSSWFDPIAYIESSQGERRLSDIGHACSHPPSTENNVMVYCNTPCPLLVAPSKRPRGRPKKFASMAPADQNAPPTSLSSELEAIDTWNVAKSIGVSSKDEAAVLNAIRKSKRLLLLEGEMS